MSRGITKGQVLIDDISTTLKEKIGAEIVRRGLTQVDVTKKFGISKIDLYNLISGKGSVPLARVIMLAADLDIKMDFKIG
jgi:transcriptional regulator with XRE-family HTH domain